MKFVKYIFIVFILGILIFPSFTLATTNVNFDLSATSLKAGETLNMNLVITPDPQINSAKLKILFNADVLEMKSFTMASGWMPVVVSGYDGIDNVGGSFTKTGGYPGGLTSKASFGTAVFVAKKDGVAKIEMSPESQILSADNKNELPPVLPQKELAVTEKTPEPIEKPIEPKPVETKISESRSTTNASDSTVNNVSIPVSSSVLGEKIDQEAEIGTSAEQTVKARDVSAVETVDNDGDKKDLEKPMARETKVLGIALSEPTVKVMEERFVEKLTKAQDVSFDVETVKTNALYTIIMILLFTFLATLTNEIFKSFSDDFDRFFHKYFPAKRLSRHDKKIREWFHKLMVLAFLIVYSFITIFLEQPESLREGLVVFLITFVAISIFVIIKESTEKIMLKRKNVETRFSYYIFGIIALIISVIISRYYEISPPLLVGIPVVLIYLSKSALAEKEEQKISTISSIVTFGVLVLVWFSAGFDNPAWQSAALLLFTLGIEDMFFTMIPLKDFPGQQVLKYSKILWFFLFAFVAVTFTFTIINPDGSVNDAYNTPISQTFMWILGAYTLVTIIVYFFARYLDKKQHERLGDKY